MRIDFGYLRCSTQEQHLDRQFEAIRRFRDIPEEYLFAEKVTGKTDNREQYQAMKVLIQRLVDINARKSEEQRDTIEVIIEELDRNTLFSLVNEVNRTEVQSTEVLSDNIYFCDENGIRIWS